MIVKCLGSSSHGNCYLMQFLKDDYKKTIMIECGFDYKETIKRVILNDAVDMFKNVNSVLITHSHSDHCKGINSFAERGLKIFANDETLSLIKDKNCYMTAIKAGENTNIDYGINCYSFSVEHDAPNSLGFIIHCTKTNELILFVNDCKFFKENLSDFKFDYVFIECNYDDKITRTLYSQAIKNGDALEASQYKRVIDSHMSFATTKKILSKLNFEKMQAIFLMHLSDRHANEFKFKKQICELTKITTLVCQKIGGIK